MKNRIVLYFDLSQIEETKTIAVSDIYNNRKEVVLRSHYSLMEYVEKWHNREHTELGDAIGVLLNDISCPVCMVKDNFWIVLHCQLPQKMNGCNSTFELKLKPFFISVFSGRRCRDQSGFKYFDIRFSTENKDKRPSFFNEIASKLHYGGVDRYIKLHEESSVSIDSVEQRLKVSSQDLQAHEKDLESSRKQILSKVVLFLLYRRTLSDRRGVSRISITRNKR